MDDSSPSPIRKVLAGDPLLILRSARDVNEVQDGRRGYPAIIGREAPKISAVMTELQRLN
jgi:hypothetical protein